MLSQAEGGLLLPACHQGVYARLRRAMEKVGMRGRFRESELVEAPPHQAEIWFALFARYPLPASGAREAARSAIAASLRDGALDQPHPLSVLSAAAVPARRKPRSLPTARKRTPRLASATARSAVWQ
jgi:hypothetical protein